MTINLNLFKQIYVFCSKEASTSEHKALSSYFDNVQRLLKIAQIETGETVGLGDVSSGLTVVLSTYSLHLLYNIDFSNDIKKEDTRKFYLKKLVVPMKNALKSCYTDLKYLSTSKFE